MSILKKIKKHHHDKTYCAIFQEVNGKPIDRIGGYIVDYSDHFLVLQESDDFLLKGYKVVPIETIAKIRHNHIDEYYDNIMRWEKIWDTLNYTHQVDLSSWTSIFSDIRKLGFNVIIEDQHPEEATFDIGPITKVTEQSVEIMYFNAEGVLNRSSTEFKWTDITLVNFDDRYINIFSKYLREPDPLSQL